MGSSFWCQAALSSVCVLCIGLTVPPLPACRSEGSLAQVSPHKESGPGGAPADKAGPASPPLFHSLATGAPVAPAQPLYPMVDPPAPHCASGKASPDGPVSPPPPPAVGLPSALASPIGSGSFLVSCA